MTTSKNFPHKVYARRISALERLERRVVVLRSIIAGTVPMLPGMKTTPEISLRRVEKEISVLQSRTGTGGGRKSTKKIHANIGR